MCAVQVAQEEMALKHSAVGLPVLLLTSMWKTNLASLWWITKLLHHAGAVASAVEGPLDVVVLVVGHLTPEVPSGVLVVDSPSGAAHNVEVGKDGEIGKRSTQYPVRLSQSLYSFYQTNRTRESSVAISPQWTMLEEIEFHRLAKLKLEVDEPEDM